MRVDTTMNTCACACVIKMGSKSPHLSLQLNETKQELENALSRLLQSSDALPHDARLGVLADEHARGLIGRILRRLVLMGEVLRDHLTRYEVLPALSVALSFGFIVLVGYLMSYLV